MSNRKLAAFPFLADSDPVRAAAGAAGTPHSRSSRQDTLTYEKCSDAGQSRVERQGRPRAAPALQGQPGSSQTGDTSVCLIGGPLPFHRPCQPTHVRVKEYPMKPSVAGREIMVGSECDTCGQCSGWPTNGTRPSATYTGSGKGESLPRGGEGGSQAHSGRQIRSTRSGSVWGVSL